MAKAKLLYFTAFLCVVIAFVFHTTAMGHHHWKRATYRENTSLGFNVTTIGLFTRCTPSEVNKVEACIPNLYSSGESCYLQGSCLPRNVSNPCHCDFLPSTKGIAACAIIAAIGLGLAVLLLFLQSINDSESRLLALVFGVFPLILLALAFIFILIALILVGSYLSRDMMYLARVNETVDLHDLRERVANSYDVRIGWASGLEIIALVMTFFSLIVYLIFILTQR